MTDKYDPKDMEAKARAAGIKVEVIDPAARKLSFEVMGAVLRATEAGMEQRKAVMWGLAALWPGTEQADGPTPETELLLQAILNWAKSKT
jgi:hypothetical protein